MLCLTTYDSLTAFGELDPCTRACRDPPASGRGSGLEDDVLNVAIMAEVPLCLEGCTANAVRRMAAQGSNWVYRAITGE
jgi:hypothetical protein